MYKNTFIQGFWFILICIFISSTCSIVTRGNITAQFDCNNAVANNAKLTVEAYVTYSGVGKGSSLK